jgi:hypothetical protein
MDNDRFLASTKIYISPFYPLLNRILKKYDYNSEDIYNLDETNYRIPSNWKVNVIIPNANLINSDPNFYLKNFGNDSENENKHNKYNLEDSSSEELDQNISTSRITFVEVEKEKESNNSEELSNDKDIILGKRKTKSLFGSVNGINNLPKFMEKKNKKYSINSNYYSSHTNKNKKPIKNIRMAVVKQKKI